jgi:hypothetical protein
LHKIILTQAASFENSGRFQAASKKGRAVLPHYLQHRPAKSNQDTIEPAWLLDVRGGVVYVSISYEQNRDASFSG